MSQYCQQFHVKAVYSRTVKIASDTCPDVTLGKSHKAQCSDVIATIRRLPSAVRTATPAFHVRSSGVFCSWPGGLELVTRLPARSVTRSFDSFRRDLKTFLFSFYQRTQRIRALRLCALYKSTVDIDVDNHVVAATAAAVAACGDAWRNAVGASSFRAPKARSLQEDCVGFRRRKSFQFTHLLLTS